MIEGLHLKISPDQLKSHLGKRVEWHTAQANLIEAEIPKIQKQHAESNMKDRGRTRDQGIARAKQFIATHREKAIQFSFIADHLWPETYSLGLSECVSLEMCPAVYLVSPGAQSGYFNQE